MTEIELNKIEKRANDARKGPWKLYIEGRDHFCGSNFIMVYEETKDELNFEITDATIEDYEFIANARQDIPMLIKEIRRLNLVIKSNNGNCK